MKLSRTIYTLVCCLLVTGTNMLHAQILEQFIATGIKNNPEIKKLELQYNITSEKTNEATTLPNTEFGAGYFVSEPETRTGPQKFKVSVKQMLPWFGTITARENYQTSLANVDYETLSVAKRKLAAAIAQSYYKLYALYQKQEVVTKNRELLTNYETIALNALEVNKASTVDVLKIKMRQNSLDSKTEELAEDYNAEMANFKSLLNNKESVVVTWPNTFTVPLNTNNTLPTDSLQLHPELIVYDKLYESVTQSELLNQKSKQPMLGFGVDYINVAERTDMSVVDNGKDIFMPMVSVSIPIFNGTYKSKTKQHKLEQQKIEAAKEERYNTLETMLAQSIAKRKAALVKFTTQQANIEQANNATGILMKSYESNTLNFQDLLDVQELQLGFELTQVDAVLQYYLQSTIINYLSN